ncbi:hypothetical protein AHAS_Ahas06G0142400 [Arachis hypogaea]
MDSERPTESKNQTEQVKVSATKRRREALQLLREKRSKRKNDGARNTNVAPNAFDSTESQNGFSETLPTVNLGSEPLHTHTSSTPFVNAPANVRYILI